MLHMGKLDDKLKLSLAVVVAQALAIRRHTKSPNGHKDVVITEDDVFWPAMRLWPQTLAHLWLNKPSDCLALSLNQTHTESKSTEEYLKWLPPAGKSEASVWHWGTQGVVLSAQGCRDYLKRAVPDDGNQLLIEGYG